MTSALSDIEKLARKVAKDANTEGDAISFQARIDALKVLTPYYLALRKERGADDENGASTMADFAEAIREDERADTKVRGRRRTQ